MAGKIEGHRSGCNGQRWKKAKINQKKTKKKKKKQKQNYTIIAPKQRLHIFADTGIAFYPAPADGDGFDFSGADSGKLLATMFDQGADQQSVIFAIFQGLDFRFGFPMFRNPSWIMPVVLGSLTSSLPGESAANGLAPWQEHPGLSHALLLELGHVSFAPERNARRQGTRVLGGWGDERGFLRVQDPWIKGRV